ncbi:endonuclease domain-containing protein [Parasphingorhabdus sp.]|jgi:very-short-patch-repair endonuclease|uniref:endonuclease domain-containing protein n=1 Tax=Parasphingorhabdus sp. TaxID=2709688 RepID=UPI003BAE3C57
MERSLSPLAGERLERGVDGVCRPKETEAPEAIIRRRAKSMRSEPTEAETKLWTILRAKRLGGYKFRQQVPIDHYIGDFVCFARKLIVEADGSQHAENSYDEKRDSYLKAEGFQILRFWNNDILNNPDGVAEAILAALKTPSPTSPKQQVAKALVSSPAGGEDEKVQYD